MFKTTTITFLVVFLSFGTMAQYQIEGVITGPGSDPIEGVRITIFNNDTTVFLENRTAGDGTFVIPGINEDRYTLGIAKENMNYQDTTFSITQDISNLNFSLETETHPGKWEVILNSPQALGGTDLGILLPDGKIFYCHDSKDPFLFDPKINDVVAASGHDQIQGCVAPLLLENGSIIFMGGTDKDFYGPGIQTIKTYHPVSEKWTILPDMFGYRWYPTASPLPDGNILITGGGGIDNPKRVNTTEIYDPVSGQSKWVDTTYIGNEVSPIVQLYNGKILMTHRPPQLFDPVTEEWDLAGDFVQSNRMPNGDHSDHELVLLPNDDRRVLAFGYISFRPDSLGNLVEIYDPLSDTWSLRSNFPPMRSRAKTVLLPNRKVLLIGGKKEDGEHPAPVNQWDQLFLTDEYDPQSDSWRRLDDLNYAREYHATTILVPDGRVITVGGEGSPGNEPEESIIEAFSPPYLFRGIRPKINQLSGEFKPGGVISFTIAYADSLTSLRMISNASVTHFMNSGNNRFLELPFEQKGDQVNTQLPLDSVSMPNGYYMVFAMVDDIPSEAMIVKVTGDSITSTIDDVRMPVKLDIFPNPASTIMYVQAPDKYKGAEGDLYIVNSTGQIVIHKKINLKGEILLNIADLPSGSYHIKVMNRDQIFSSSFIKI